MDFSPRLSAAISVPFSLRERGMILDLSGLSVLLKL